MLAIGRPIVAYRRMAKRNEHVLLDAFARAMSNDCSVSNTCGGHARKIQDRPAGPKGTAPRRGTFWGLKRRNWNDPLTLTIRYVGKAEPWVEVKTRGVTKRYPGDTCVLHLVSDINSRLTATSY
jgi:hypothetical protein